MTRIAMPLGGQHVVRLEGLEQRHARRDDRHDVADVSRSVFDPPTDKRLASAA